MPDLDVDAPGFVDAIFAGLNGLLDRLTTLSWENPLFWIIVALLLIVAWRFTGRRGR